MNVIYDKLYDFFINSFFQSNQWNNEKHHTLLIIQSYYYRKSLKSMIFRQNKRLKHDGIYILDEMQSYFIFL